MVHIVADIKTIATRRMVVVLHALFVGHGGGHYWGVLVVGIALISIGPR